MTDTLGSLQRKLSYQFPRTQVALRPASPRDSARLLVTDTQGKIVAEDFVVSLGNYLPERSLIVVNQTKVYPARLECIRVTGGRVRLLFIGQVANAIGPNVWKVLADRPLKNSEQVGCADSRITVLKKEGSEYTVSVTGAVKKLLDLHGHVPLPPYLRHSPLSERQRALAYQTRFAKQSGSVAAPTASLHFTDQLIKKLIKQGHSFAYVTLHVGLGTFASVTKQNWREGSLHTERYEITEVNAKRINQALRSDQPIVAVGTTVFRTLESSATQKARRVEVRSGKKETKLFIRPRKKAYRPKVASLLMTNFHVPGSSLLMLVAALLGVDSAMRVYRYAVRKKYRLFSFGDAMLIRLRP